MCYVSKNIFYLNPNALKVLEIYTHTHTHTHTHLNADKQKFKKSPKDFRLLGFCRTKGKNP